MHSDESGKLVHVEDTLHPDLVEAAAASLTLFLQLIKAIFLVWFVALSQNNLL